MCIHIYVYTYVCLCVCVYMEDSVVCSRSYKKLEAEMGLEQSCNPKCNNLDCHKIQVCGYLYGYLGGGQGFDEEEDMWELLGADTVLFLHRREYRGVHFMIIH